MTAFRRWAAIVLPFVILARVVLLVFQLHGEHHDEAHRFDPPAWPPSAGEELRFRSDDPHLAAWGTAANHPQLLVPETLKDFMPTEADSGCVLDLLALSQHGGTLTVREEMPPQGWRAEWSGGATVPSLKEMGDTDTDPKTRTAQADLMDAADCGGTGRVELTGYQLEVLVAFLSGGDFPPAPDPAPRIRPVHIHVDGPPPPGWPASGGDQGTGK